MTVFLVASQTAGYVDVNSDLRLVVGKHDECIKGLEGLSLVPESKFFCLLASMFDVFFQTGITSILFKPEPKCESHGFVLVSQTDAVKSIKQAHKDAGNCAEFLDISFKGSAGLLKDASTGENVVMSQEKKVSFFQ